MDSTVWSEFQFREDDIIIGAYVKFGTTWTQKIVPQLLFNGQEGLNLGERSPWMNLRVPAKAEKPAAAEAQTFHKGMAAGRKPPKPPRTAGSLHC
jgi:aryl sulfotransferase